MDNYFGISLDAANSLTSLWSIGRQADDDAVSAFDAMMDFEGGENPILNVIGDRAEITVRGTLLNERSRFALLYGYGTPYPAILDAVSRVKADTAIRSVDFVFNSPGGAIAGVEPVIQAVRELSTLKTTRAVVQDLCASCAYFIAAQCGSIVSVNQSSTVGSIGVLMIGLNFENLVVVRSSNAPDKAPTVQDDEGITRIRAMLDQYEAIFIAETAQGRGVSADTVKEGFGRGATFVHQAALERSMVDGVYQGADKPTVPFETGVEAMDLAKFKAEHPELFAQITSAARKEGRDAGYAEGVTAERDRVGALMVYADAGGDEAMKIIRPLLESGEAITDTVRAKLSVAGMNRAQAASAVADNPDSGQAGSAPAGAGSDAEEQELNDIEDMLADCNPSTPDYAEAYGRLKAAGRDVTRFTAPVV